MPLPNSLPWMESVDAKLTRAREHLNVFEQEATAFAEQARPTFVRKTNAELTQHWLVYYVEDPFPPIRLSVVIGDCLYNMRSALDSLICGLVRKVAPSQECGKAIQFPILDDPKKFPGERGKLVNYLPAEALTLIESLQPYQRPNALQLDPLWVLNELCNRDKHRSTLLTMCYHSDVELLIPFIDGRTLLVTLPKTIYAGQPDTVPLPGPVSAMANNMDVKIKGRTNFTFRLEGRLGERPANEILVACLRYVEDRVVPCFKPFFG